MWPIFIYITGFKLNICSLSEQVYDLHGQKFTEFLVVQDWTDKLIPGDRPVSVSVHLQPGVVGDVVLSHGQVGVVGSFHYSRHVQYKFPQLGFRDDAVIVDIKYSKYLKTLSTLSSEISLSNWKPSL